MQKVRVDMVCIAVLVGIARTECRFNYGTRAPENWRCIDWQ